MYRAVIFLSLAACSKAAPPVTEGSGSAKPPVVTVADAAPSIDAALKACFAGGPADNATVKPGAVDFCGGDAPARSCWNFDVATKQFSPRPVVAHVDRPLPAETAKLANGELSLCTPDGKCRSVKPTIKLAESDQLGTNADATLLARQPEGAKTLEIYDTTTWKQRAKIAAFTVESNKDYAELRGWTFVGPNVIAWTNATPISSKGRIFTPDGKLVGEIGDKLFTLDTTAVWFAEGNTWLFKQLDDNRLIAVDVVTGKTTKTYTLSALQKKDEAPVGAVDLASTPTTIVLLAETGAVEIVARDTGKVEVIAPPACP